MRNQETQLHPAQANHHNSCELVNHVHEYGRPPRLRPVGLRLLNVRHDIGAYSPSLRASRWPAYWK